MKEGIKKFVKELIMNTVIAFIASVGTMMAIGIVGTVVEKIGN